MKYEWRRVGPLGNTFVMKDGKRFVGTREEFVAYALEMLSPIAPDIKETSLMPIGGRSRNVQFWIPSLGSVSFYGKDVK